MAKVPTPTQQEFDELRSVVSELLNRVHVMEHFIVQKFGMQPAQSSPRVAEQLQKATTIGAEHQGPAAGKQSFI